MARACTVSGICSLLVLVLNKYQCHLNLVLSANRLQLLEMPRQVLHLHLPKMSLRTPQVPPCPHHQTPLHRLAYWRQKSPPSHHACRSVRVLLTRSNPFKAVCIRAGGSHQERTDLRLLHGREETVGTMYVPTRIILNNIVGAYNNMHPNRLAPSLLHSEGR